MTQIQTVCVYCGSSSKTAMVYQDTAIQMGDAFLVLSGGFGTLDEFFEILTWRQIKLHNKPIILINVNKYWEFLISFIKQVTEHQFAKKEDIDLITLVDSPEEAITVLHSFRQTHPSYQSGINTIKSF